MSDTCEPSNTEREVHELTHLPPQPWREQCVKGRSTENPHKRVTFERAESTVPVISVLGVARRGHRVREDSAMAERRETLR